MTTREELRAKARVARRASFDLAILKGAEAGARLLKEDLAAPPIPTSPPLGPTPGGNKVPGAGGPVAKVVDFQGLQVHVDRPRGHVMNGVDEKGKAWKRTYYVDYGFVPGTQGGDQDGLDVFLGLDADASDAHWILQKKADGSFDEYKVMLGFSDPDIAKGMYLAHVPKRFFGGCATTSIGMMKALLGIHPSETFKALAAFAVEREEKANSIFELLKPEYRPAEYRERDVKILLGEETAKADLPAGEQRYTLGIVLEPETVDAQGDIYSADEIRKAAWSYMTNFRNVGLMHKGLVNGRVQLVESYIAPIAMTVGGSTIKAGTWLMGLHIPDDTIWNQVKKGELTGLSIGGFAKKTPA